MRKIGELHPYSKRILCDPGNICLTGLAVFMGQAADRMEHPARKSRIGKILKRNRRVLYYIMQQRRRLLVLGVQLLCDRYRVLDVILARLIDLPLMRCSCQPQRF